MYQVALSNEEAAEILVHAPVRIQSRGEMDDSGRWLILADSLWVEDETRLLRYFRNHPSVSNGGSHDQALETLTGLEVVRTLADARIQIHRHRLVVSPAEQGARL